MPRLRCADRILDLTHPCVMGVLNVTPDSFSDGGRFGYAQEAIAAGVQLAAEGALLIDVGGESTRPGAEAVSAAQELERVLPVIAGLREHTTAVISVDTSKPEVMRAAARAGAGLINDVRALREPGALEAALQSGCAICLMHMQGEPRTMQLNPHYENVVTQVREFLAARVQHCLAQGFSAEQLLLDPGFGFGKTMEHNLALLRQLDALAPPDMPLLVGLSRKSMLGKLTGRAVGERLYGSIALAVIAASRGAHIIRAHDVAATVDALKVLSAVEGGG